MLDITLQRTSQSDQGTFGVLSLEGVPLCLTLEDPWNNNQTGISCIPTGTYSCTRHSGEKYKNVWLLNNVPGRSAILIHQGNTIDDTRGCILVGWGLAKLNGKRSITQSKDALDDLRGKLPDNFTIHIKDPK